MGIEAFVAIAERGSFQRAAAHLNLSQTALSHRMRKLEEDLGVQLLARTTRQITLTAAGQDLLPKARRLMAELEGELAALRGQAGARQERIAFGCLPTIAAYHLPRILAAFRERHPDVAVKIYDNSASEIAALVQKGEADSASASSPSMAGIWTSPRCARSPSWCCAGRTTLRRPVLRELVPA